MRLVFWLFLLLNLAFFYWHYSQSQTVEPPLLQTEALPAGVERLVLLRERGLGTQNPAQSSSSPTPPPLATTTETETGFSVEPRATEEATPAPGPVTVVEQAQPNAAPEPATGMKPAPEAMPETETPVEPPPPIVLTCFTLGPFKDESDAGRMYKALRALDITPQQRLSERREAKGYWVYLPPRKSYADARRKVQALKEKGLDDMYVMGKGKMKNAISLGIFSRKSTATDRFNEVRRLDPATMMKPRYRSIKEKWLDISIDSAHTETLARIAALADSQQGIELVQRKVCK